MINVKIVLNPTDQRASAIAAHSYLGPAIIRFTVSIVEQCLDEPFSLSLDVPDELRHRIADTFQHPAPDGTAEWTIEIHPSQGPLSPKRILSVYSRMKNRKTDMVTSLVKPHVNCHPQWLKFAVSDEVVSNCIVHSELEGRPVSLRLGQDSQAADSEMAPVIGSQWLSEIFISDNALRAYRADSDKRDGQIEHVPYCPDNDATLALLYKIPFFCIDGWISPDLSSLVAIGDNLFETLQTKQFAIHSDRVLAETRI